MSQRILKEVIKRMLVESDSIEIGAIYCDMDGVLVDFEAGAIKLLTDILDGTADPKYTIGSNSIPKKLEKLRKEKGEDWRPHTKEDIQVMRSIMIPAIRRAPDVFFFDLPPLVDGVSDLWKCLNGLGPSVHILSAPIESNEDTTTKKSEPVPIEGDEKAPATTSAAGKRNWVKKYLETMPPKSVIIAAADEKQNWAIDKVSGLPNLLVDDKEKTINQWNARGGIGILHTPGDSASSIKRIKNLGI